MAEKKTYTSKNPTGCCPVPDVKAWDESQVVWKDKKFIKDKTICLFHIPLNMGKMMKRAWGKIQAAKAAPKTENWLMLSDDPSPWVGEHYLSVTKEVPDAENVTLSGTFLTKVFEGPFQEAPKWMAEMEKYLASKNKKAKKMYFFYTTCPKCAKYYGKNYTIAFAQV